jgi:hypothetical protein
LNVSKRKYIFLVKRVKKVVPFFIRRDQKKIYTKRISALAFNEESKSRVIIGYKDKKNRKESSSGCSVA